MLSLLSSGKVLIFITGLSGNGKTMNTVLVQFKKLIRVNITIEADEDDLLGGIDLKMDVVWFEWARY